ncbi:hypothetical protein DY000_02042403 [Brassica cretica]|uniref:Uncharacterized protein n=1 Tax=Brassica cretica TaxID=69181 RepID=A0ABQ7B598_BRACR|nr:hypothetical protein DY000_02042403 [Brassica cretica]
MSGNTKEKIAVHNNAGKKTPAATAPMANAYANATVLEKIENLAATFCHRKCNETSLRFFFLNIKGNDKSYQTLATYIQKGLCQVPKPRRFGEFRSSTNVIKPKPVDQLFRRHKQEMSSFKLSVGDFLDKLDSVASSQVKISILEDVLKKLDQERKEDEKMKR